MNLINVIPIAISLVGFISPFAYQHVNSSIKEIDTQSVKKIYTDSSSYVDVNDFTVTAYNIERKYETYLKYYVYAYRPEVYFYYYVYDSNNKQVDSYSFYKKDRCMGNITHYLKLTGIDYWNYIGTLYFKFCYSIPYYNVGPIYYANFELNFRSIGFSDTSNELKIYRSAKCYPKSGYLENVADVVTMKNLSHYYEVLNYSYFDFNDKGAKINIFANGTKKSGNGYIIGYFKEIEGVKIPNVYALTNNNLSFTKSGDDYSLITTRTYYVDQATNNPYSTSSNSRFSTTNFYYPFEYYEEFKTIKLHMILTDFFDYNLVIGYDITVTFLNGPKQEVTYDVVGEIEDKLDDDTLKEIKIP